MMKILVVEDDPSIAQTLEILLSSYRYAVDVAADGETGLQMTDAFDYDLVLLDVWLPGVDGITVCQRLRAKGLKMPILVLTAQNGATQKVNALNVGADDYVLKPFDDEELMARVQALLRRGGTKTQPILAWGNLSFEPSSLRVTYGNHLLSLTPKEYGTLELFLRNPQQVFSARAILDQVWSSVESPGEDTVRSHMKGLRKKLKAVGAPEDFIETVYRMGYRLNPLYATVLISQTEEQSQTEEPPQTEEQPTVPRVADPKSGKGGLRATVAGSQSAPAELAQSKQALEVPQQSTEQELQRLQAQLQQLQGRNEKLEQQVAELTAALVEANRQLQQQDEEQMEA